MRYTTADRRMEVEFEGADGKEIFQQVAAFQEIFEESCGNCNNGETRLTVRRVDDYVYYERVCPKCGHRLAYGQQKKGGALFPRRYEGDGSARKPLGKNGWTKWHGGGSGSSPSGGEF